MGCLPVRSHNDQSSVLVLREMIPDRGIVLIVRSRSVIGLSSLAETAGYGVSKKIHTYSCA